MTADKDLDARRREAASWFATLNQKRVAASDVTAFSQWRRRPENAEAFARIETMWETAGSLRGDADIAALTQDARARADASRRSQGRLAKSLVPMGALATIAAIVVGVAVWSARPQSYETSLGERRVVVLAEGSRVTLDTDSRISVKLTRGRRAVELASGQAFFEVQGDPARPFVVSAGATDVIAVGTRFDVRRAGDGAQVTLVEGKVEVSDPSAVTQGWSLTPGQQIVTTSPRPAVRSVDVASETSWTSGRLIFAGDTVEAAVAEVNRYSRTKVVLEAPAISRIAVSGAFNTGDVEAFVSALTELYPVVAERTPAGQIVLRDASAKNPAVR
ncbi:FecR family protein [Brevundimonas variabilis]|uniref:Transmembrane sensor n=1 Tax=Brevundimonas variabilis TaxID=74312 RepID=A0A7W9FH45_9CAUL|nr:FecR domain-containing protein [Brevundimonas variabilis]MBB5747089.1 transmembrane sensor [Brevundimonas variabilis]